MGLLMPRSDSPPPGTTPTVVVLLATYNGERFLKEQLASILNQRGVAVRVIALDDASTDTTPALLAAAAGADPRITVLPVQGRSGSAAANFARLLLEAPFDDDALIAFADQDDVWMPDKLTRHVELLQSDTFDGVSSNVIAFDEHDRRTLVRKDFPQRKFDYLLESPGPGSTFLFTGRLANLAREHLSGPDAAARAVDYHDWLLYALCRAQGWRWHIDSVPSVLYRQHDANVMGSNVGLASARERLRLIRRHWHRQQALILAQLSVDIAPDATRAELTSIAEALATRTMQNRRTLLSYSSEFRRRPRDRRAIAVLIALGIW